MSVVGGHSIDDAEPKVGYAVVGLVHPARIWRNVGARPGRRPRAHEAARHRHHLDGDQAGQGAGAGGDGGRSARWPRLNRAAAEAAATVPVHAATDVTGFGLLGHLREMTRGSKVRVRLHAARIPLLPDVVALAEAGLVPGGTKRNLAGGGRDGAVGSEPLRGAPRRDRGRADVGRAARRHAGRRGAPREPWRRRAWRRRAQIGEVLGRGRGGDHRGGAVTARLAGGPRRRRHGRPGRGIGREIALLMAASGARVVVNDLGGAADGSGGAASPADDVVREIQAAGGQAAPSYESVTTMAGGAADRRDGDRPLRADRRRGQQRRDRARPDDLQHDRGGVGRGHRRPPEGHLRPDPGGRAALPRAAVGAVRQHDVDVRPGRQRGAGELRRGEARDRRAHPRDRARHGAVQRDGELHLAVRLDAADRDDPDRHARAEGAGRQAREDVAPRRRAAGRLPRLRRRGRGERADLRRARAGRSSSSPSRGRCARSTSGDGWTPERLAEIFRGTLGHHLVPLESSAQYFSYDPLV